MLKKLVEGISLLPNHLQKMELPIYNYDFKNN